MTRPYLFEETEREIESYRAIARELRARHYRYTLTDRDGVYYCRACHGTWPCTSRRAAHAIFKLCHAWLNEMADVQMLARHTSALYDWATHGDISIPTTDPQVVITLGEDKISEYVQQVLDEVEGIHDRPGGEE